MCHDDSRHPEVLPRPDHQPVDHRRRDRIESGRGLVIEDVARPERDRARDPHALAHAPGQLGRQPVASPREIDQRQRLVDPLLDFLVVQGPLLQSQREIVRHRHRIEQRRELEDVADPLAQLGQPVPIERADGLAVNDDVACIGVQQADDVFQGHALARSRVSDDHHGFGVADLERETLQHLFPVKSLMQVLELDHSSTTAQNASSTRIKIAE